MVKRIILFFFLFQVLLIGGVFWFFAMGSEGRLNWAQEAWRRMNDDNAQHCFDVVKESGIYGPAPSIKLLGGEESPELVMIHYRVNRSEGRFQEQVHECLIKEGVIDKIEERNRMLARNFGDIGTELFHQN